MKFSEKKESPVRVITEILLFMTIVFLITAPEVFSSSSPHGNKENEETKKKNKGKIVILPVIFYSPETKLAFGTGGLYTFYASKIRNGLKPSNIQMLAYYTLNRQYWFEIKPDVYLKNNNYHFYGTLNYTKFLDKFWGIGTLTNKEDEEKYISLISRIKIYMLRRLNSPLSVGLAFEYEHHNIVEVEEGGKLDPGTIPGSEGGTISGLGALVQWDSRDHIFSPSKGSFFQLSLKLYKPFLGSSFDFALFNLDLRRYMSLFSSHVLALQAYINLLSGSPPLQMLSRLGGQYLMRGYYNGRYRDKNMYIFQAEYRLPLWRRLGVAGFLAVGDVGGKLSDFSFKTVKITFGLGIRFRINPEEKMNLRLDIGFSPESSGVYFNINEAF